MFRHLVTSPICASHPSLGRGLELQWRRAQVVAVAEEVNGAALADGALGGLNPLAPAGAVPHAAQEPEGAALSVGAIVAAHDGLDGLRSLVGVVEGDGADVVVKDVRLDDTVQELSANKAKLTIDGGGSAANVVPALTTVVRECRIGVLKVRDGNFCDRG